MPLPNLPVPRRKVNIEFRNIIYIHHILELCSFPSKVERQVSDVKRCIKGQTGGCTFEFVELCQQSLNFISLHMEG